MRIRFILFFLAFTPWTSSAESVIDNALNNFADSLLGTSSSDSNTTQLTLYTPNLTLLKQTPMIQREGGLTLALSGITDTPKIAYRLRYTPRLTLLVVNGQQSYEEWYEPVAATESNRLRFKLRISNNSKRVIRPKNAILVIEVDGDQQVLDENQAEEFLNLLVTPGSSREVTLYGPSLNRLPLEGGLIRLAIYELGAGDNLHNFEWMFKLSISPRTERARTAMQVVSMTKWEMRERQGRIVGKDALPAMTKQQNTPHSKTGEPDPDKDSPFFN